MPQLIIDPGDAPQTASGTVSITPIPKKTRQFGFVPDLRCCKAGDLILSHSVSPGFLDRQITHAQIKAGFSTDDSRWTHAAVFLYEDFVVEAVPWKGVVTRSLYSDIPESLLRVRRRPDLEDAERYKIALCAQRMLGTRYNYKAALSLGWRALLSGVWDRAWFPSINSVIICSKVFYDAHVEITRKLLHGCPISDLVMPANLSATSDLEDILPPWVRLNPAT
jgi:hypothetical protein